MELWIAFVVLIIFALVTLIIAGLQYWEWLSSGKVHHKLLFLLSALLSAVFILWIFSKLTILILPILPFLAVIILGAFAKMSLRCKKREGPYKVGDVEYYLCDSKVLNAWYDPKENKIFVSKDFAKVLEKDELYAVLLHEMGHSKNKKLRICNGLLRGIWAYIVGCIVLIITVSSFIANTTAETKITLIVLLYIFALVITPPILALSWIEEHEADLTSRHANLEESLVTALIKLELLRRSPRYLNVDLSINVKKIDVQEVRKLDVLKEFLYNVMISVPITVFDFIKRPIYITHPPIWLRAYYLKKLPS